MRDLRDEIFGDILRTRVTAAIVADEGGVVAGTRAAAEEGRSLGLTVTRAVDEGAVVRPGEEIARVEGNPKQIALAEDLMLGLIAKPSGIATATRRCVERAGTRVQVVCGAWKKMPAAFKETIRSAVLVGGGRVRISDEPFVYLDKNYVRMLGGIGKSLGVAGRFRGYRKVVQIKGDRAGVAEEAREAAESGADIIYLDNGRAGDLRAVAKVLEERGVRDRVRIAFGGNVKPEDLEKLRDMPVDIIDVGRYIVDAPLLDLKLDVLGVRGEGGSPSP